MPAMLVILAVAMSTAQGQPGDHETDKVWKATASVAYFTPLRGSFQDIYGDGIIPRFTLERSLTLKLSLGIRAEHVSLKDSDLGLEYRNLALMPSIKYLWLHKGGNQLSFALGLGFNFRRVTASFLWEGSKDQTDLGESLFGSIMYDRRLSGQIIARASATLDFIYDPHPSRGDFGNTGGLSFAVGSGVVF
jgi:hypothetical protein